MKDSMASSLQRSEGSQLLPLSARLHSEKASAATAVLSQNAFRFASPDNGALPTKVLRRSFYSSICS